MQLNEEMKEGETWTKGEPRRGRLVWSTGARRGQGSVSAQPTERTEEIVFKKMIERERDRGKGEKKKKKKQKAAGA